MDEKIEEQNKKIEEKKETAKKEMKDFAESSKTFIEELLNIRDTTNTEGTIQNIKENIAVKGHTAWILVFSILIASIGLNVGSIPVVIGAMLISPLMGPILGIGLSIGTNDIDTLKRSLVNLGVMIALSLITSFLFFSIPLFQEFTSELEARTQPNVLDVLIAISGGLALIIAISRPSAQTNTVAGVAIATALMPPLCTAGYALAVNIDYFFGAMFLFLINTTFIALSTFVVVKYLRFPMVRYINSVKRKLISRIASFLAIIVLSASVYTFYNLVLQKDFYEKSQLVLKKIENEGYGLIDESKDDINYEKKTIKITVYGKPVFKKDEDRWNNYLKEFGLENAKIIPQGGNNDSKVINEVQSLKELTLKNQQIIEGREAQLRSKDERISLLEKELERQNKTKIPFLKISEEAKINYDSLVEIAYSNRINTNFKKIDTVAVFQFKWAEKTPKKTIQKEKLKLTKWLKTRLNLDTLVVVK